MRRFSAEQLIRAMARLDQVMEALAMERPGPLSSGRSETGAGDHVCSYEEETNDYDNDEKLAKMMIGLWNDPYGPSKRYLQGLVRRYLSWQTPETTGVESESLMELVLLTLRPHQAQETLSGPPQAEECCHLSFQLPVPAKSSSPWLRLRIFPHHNDVALRLWEAGAALAEYVMRHPEMLGSPKGDCRKRVVELGAGVGLPSLVAALVGGASHVYCTDYTERALENLQHNIQINYQEWQHHLGHRSRPGEKDEPIEEDEICPTLLPTLAVGYLEWNAYGYMHDLIQETYTTTTPVDCRLAASAQWVDEADVMLAADVAYDATLIDGLTRSVRRFLSARKTSEPSISSSSSSSSSIQESRKKVYLAMTLRNTETFRLLIKALEEQGIALKPLLNADSDYRDEHIVFPVRFTQPRSDVQIWEAALPSRSQNVNEFE